MSIVQVPTKKILQFMRTDAGFNCKSVVMEAATPGGRKRYYLEGIFVEPEIWNRNKRFYPGDVVDRAVPSYISEFVDTKRAIGELGHPADPNVNLDRGCIRTEKLTKDGKNYNGKALVSGPLAKVVEGYIDDGTQLGVSTRGLADTDEEGPNAGFIRDWVITAIDVVWHPSAPSALVQGVMEGRMWVWDNGIISPATVESIKKTIIATPSRQLDKVILESFNRYMQSLLNEPINLN